MGEMEDESELREEQQRGGKSEQLESQHRC